MTQLNMAHVSFPANSMIFDLNVEDETHTTLYVKTRYTVYLYDVMSPDEARAMIQLIKDTVEWDLFSQRYNPVKWAQFRKEWPETMSQPNYHPNF
jgi:hypothetical protein